MGLQEREETVSALGTFLLPLGKAKRLSVFLYGSYQPQNYFPLQQADSTVLLPTSRETPAPQLTLPNTV